MNARALVLLLACAAAASAQLQLLIVDPAGERAVAGAADLGRFETGEAIQAPMRVKNLGALAVKLEKIEIAGAGFSLAAKPKLPVVLLTGAAADLAVAFQPAAPGECSAVLSVNDTSFLVVAAARPGPVISLSPGGPLASGALVDFGSIDRRASTSRRFHVENRNGEPIAVTTLATTGEAFRVADQLALPIEIKPGGILAFRVAFEPRAAGVAEGTLQIGPRFFQLRGASIDPPLPRPLIAVETAALRSGQQAKLSVRLDAPAQTNASGTLRMEPAGMTDDAIQFLSPPGRVIQFLVNEGEQIARFAGRADIAFQTGTSAGAIVFTAEIGSFKDQTTVQIGPLAPVLDSVRLTRAAASVEVEATGFDNSRSASEVSFTFFDPNGNAIGRGPIRVDATQEFARHFTASTLGGVFSLRAVFPVTGSVAGIDSLEIEIRNSTGPSRRSVKMTE